MDDVNEQLQVRSLPTLSVPGRHFTFPRPSNAADGRTPAPLAGPGTATYATVPSRRSRSLKAASLMNNIIQTPITQRHPIKMKYAFQHLLNTITERKRIDPKVFSTTQVCFCWRALLMRLSHLTARSWDLYWQEP